MITRENYVYISSIKKLILGIAFLATLFMITNDAYAVETFTRIINVEETITIKKLYTSVTLLAKNGAVYISLNEPISRNSFELIPNTYLSINFPIKKGNILHIKPVDKNKVVTVKGLMQSPNKIQTAMTIGRIFIGFAKLGTIIFGILN